MYSNEKYGYVRRAEFPGYTEASMKLVRIVILLFMGFVVLCMVVLPGFWDTKRRAQAHKAHAMAPSEATRLGIQKAKRLDWEDIKRFEFTCVGILLVFGYLFMRANPKRLHAVLPANGEN